MAVEKSKEHVLHFLIRFSAIILFDVPMDVGCKKASALTSTRSIDGCWGPSNLNLMNKNLSSNLLILPTSPLVCSKQAELLTHFNAIPGFGIGVGWIALFW